MGTLTDDTTTIADSSRDGRADLFADEIYLDEWDHPHTFALINKTVAEVGIQMLHNKQKHKMIKNKSCY